MRPIPPTLKETPRYAFVRSGDRALFARIESRYAELFGTIGLAQARLARVEEPNGLIIRVNVDDLPRLRVVIASLEGAIGIEAVSGTLARLRTNYLKRPPSRDANEREGERR